MGDEQAASPVSGSVATQILAVPLALGVVHYALAGERFNIPRRIAVFIPPPVRHYGRLL